MAVETTELAKNVIGFLLTGIGATVLFLMPGYLLGTTMDRGRQGPAVSERAFVAHVAVGSLVVHLMMLWWTAPLASDVVQHGPGRDAGQIAAWTMIVLLVVPVALGAGLSFLADVRRPAWLHRLLVRIGLSSVTRVSEAWDWVFSRGFPAYVRVRLTEGRVVYGLYADRSFASSDPAHRDLYLQQRWTDEDDWFAEPYPGSRGIWLNGSSIVSIEFFDGREADPDDPA
ncbi:MULTISPECIES: DUF6338 family protein [Streptomyces]|uniref:DUF6338 family protein n=1 Tax=Streptomyces TaxID=1883 RepID=UPI0004CD2BD3|nr:DUF6338 family protein [Streptomyces durhamensis]